MLVATNFLGINTAAIMATEAQYAEMWAQDAGAMYGYAGSSAAAATLTPFTPPRQNTNPAGLAAQSAAVANSGGTQTWDVGRHDHPADPRRYKQGAGAGHRQLGNQRFRNDPVHYFVGSLRSFDRVEFRGDRRRFDGGGIDRRERWTQ